RTHVARAGRLYRQADGSPACRLYRHACDHVCPDPRCAIGAPCPPRTLRDRRHVACRTCAFRGLPLPPHPMRGDDTAKQEIERTAKAIRDGDRVARARAITLVESAKPEDQARAEALLDELLPST